MSLTNEFPRGRPFTAQSHTSDGRLVQFFGDMLAAQKWRGFAYDAARELSIDVSIQTLPDVKARHHVLDTPTDPALVQQLLEKMAPAVQEWENKISAKQKSLEERAENNGRREGRERILSQPGLAEELDPHIQRIYGISSSDKVTQHPGGMD